MNKHVVKIIDSNYLNDDFKRFVITKPSGFNFIPGQSVYLSINTTELKDEIRPFTLTGLNNWESLELIIRIKTDHNGVTYKLDKLASGAELLISNAWGTIQYKGNGVFIAAGSGITPFIAILRELKEKNEISGDSLIYCNQMYSDVILENELRFILGDQLNLVFTRQNIIGFREKRIDETYLKQTIRNFNQHFYVCGPKEFVEDIIKMLADMGISAQTIVFEEKGTRLNLTDILSK
ncbi:MAG: FAD-binding oxidoreductase [Daejeonella sp.]